MKLLNIVFLILITDSSLAQNLIKNPSFEEVRSDQEQEYALNWVFLGSNNHTPIKLTVGNGRHYFSDIQIQSPRSGVKIAAFAGHFLGNEHHASYISQKLDQPLIQGEKYRVVFYASLSESSRFYLKDIGAVLSENPLLPMRIKGKKGSRIQNVYPQIKADSLLGSWDQWMEVSGTYTSKGGERYITIGAFGSFNRLVYGKKTQYMLSVYNSEISSQIRLKDMYWYYLDDVSLAHLPTDTLSRFESGQSMSLEHVLFETSSSQLRSSSFDELDSLIFFLEKNPTYKVRIGGYTDNEGESVNNFRLSQDRAKAVARYLVSKGVTSSQIAVKGFGSSNPIASNSTEEGRRKNRRVEIILLEKVAHRE